MEQEIKRPTNLGGDKTPPRFTKNPDGTITVRVTPFEHRGKRHSEIKLREPELGDLAVVDETFLEISTSKVFRLNRIGSTIIQFAARLSITNPDTASSADMEDALAMCRRIKVMDMAYIVQAIADFLPGTLPTGQ